MADWKPISKKIRFEIFKRDKYTCQYCGRTPPNVVLEVDHVIPVCDGGDNDPMNLVLACFDCNRGKAGTPLSSVPEAVADQLARRQELAKQTRDYNKFLLKERREADKAVQAVGTYYLDQVYEEKGRWSFGPDRAKSIRQFLKQLPQAELLDAVDVAFLRFPTTKPETEPEKTWRYFCGVCWTKIKGADR
jgi:hypothetical protein